MKIRSLFKEKKTNDIINSLMGMTISLILIEILLPKALEEVSNRPRLREVSNAPIGNERMGVIEGQKESGIYIHRIQPFMKVFDYEPIKIGNLELKL